MLRRAVASAARSLCRSHRSSPSLVRSRALTVPRPRGFKPPRSRTALLAWTSSRLHRTPATGSPSSPALKRGIDWVLRRDEKTGSTMCMAGAMVPHWLRGAESVTLSSPASPSSRCWDSAAASARRRRHHHRESWLSRRFDEYRSAPRSEGRSVLFDAPFVSAGRDSGVPSRGCDRRVEASAGRRNLIRSVTPYSMRTPRADGIRFDCQKKFRTRRSR